MNVGIIGAGLMGQKRAAAMKGAKLIAVCDPNQERAQQLAKQYGAAIEKDAAGLTQRSDVDAVIISTPHDMLTACAIRALKAGKHVLVEKPAGRNREDAQNLLAAAQRSKSVACVGFNHRFHPSFQKAKQLLNEGHLGPLMYIRARYGHGGRVGYEKEWRADPKISGGGELLDQGVHLIDLCRYMGGEFNFGWAKTKSFFWPMPVEDNAFLYLESPDEKHSAFLHASWSEWKNLFSFEIFTRMAKLEITGLGRSYGAEELKIYRMKPEMGPPDIETLSFSGEDVSWQAEFDAFISEINGRAAGIAKPQDALQAMNIVAEAYRCNASS